MKQLSVKSSPVSGAEGFWCPTIIFHLGRCGFPVPHTVCVRVCTSRGCVCTSRGSLYFQGLCVYFQGLCLYFQRHGRANNGLAGK